MAKSTIEQFYTTARLTHISFGLLKGSLSDFAFILSIQLISEIYVRVNFSFCICCLMAGYLDFSRYQLTSV